VKIYATVGNSEEGEEVENEAQPNRKVENCKEDDELRNNGSLVEIFRAFCLAKLKSVFPNVYLI